ncbi:MAG: hypothetical protein Q8K75_00780 [Chlamydiales bacterium]|nr:hypothetical protein [Chlamydiales bacterium]
MSTAIEDMMVFLSFYTRINWLSVSYNFNNLEQWKWCGLTVISAEGLKKRWLQKLEDRGEAWGYARMRITGA